MVTQTITVSAKENKYVAEYLKAVKKGERSHYITHTRDGKRSVKKGNAVRSRMFDKKDEAINYASSIAKRSNTEVVIFKKDGTIQRRINRQ